MAERGPQPRRRFSSALLVAVRTNAGLSREQLAVRTGLSYSTITGLELGGRPSLDTFELLIDALGVEPSQLLELNPEHPDHRPTNDSAGGGS